MRLRVTVARECHRIFRWTARREDSPFLLAPCSSRCTHSGCGSTATALQPKDAASKLHVPSLAPLSTRRGDCDPPCCKHGSYEHDVLGLIVTQPHCHPAEVTSVGEQHVAWQANGQRGAYVQLAWSGPNSVDVAVPRRGRTGSAQDERAHNRLRLKKRICATLRLALGGPVEAPSRAALPSQFRSRALPSQTRAGRSRRSPSRIPEQFPEFAKLRRARLGRVSPRARRRRRARPRRGGGGGSNSDS